MASALAEATVMVNDNVIGIVPNTLEFDEGLGEQKILPVSVGGGKVEQLYANDLESNFATVKFQMRVTVSNVETLKGWQQNANRNVVNVAAEDADGNDLTRVFTQATIMEAPNIQIQTEGVIDVSFNANAPI